MALNTDPFGTRADITALKNLQDTAVGWAGDIEGILTKIGQKNLGNAIEKDAANNNLPLIATAASDGRVPTEQMPAGVKTVSQPFNNISSGRGGYKDTTRKSFCKSESIRWFYNVSIWTCWNIIFRT